VHSQEGGFVQSVRGHGLGGDMSGSLCPGHRL